MHTFLTLVYVLAAISIIALVLIQPSRGGGISVSSQAASRMFGAQGANKLLVKITAVLIVIFMITTMALARMSLKKTSVMSGVTPNSNTMQPSSATPPAKAPAQ